MYTEPAALEITAVMTQLRSVLFEYKTLAELEHNAAKPSRKPPGEVDPKQPPMKKSNSSEPTRPPSIRCKGNKPPTTISGGSLKLPEPTRNNNKRPAENSPVSSRKRTPTEPPSKSGSDSSEIEYTEDSLMLKTKEKLFEICKHLHIDISRSSKKDLIYLQFCIAIIDRKNASSS